MLSYMPSLVLRTRYTAAAVELNGALAGECAPEEGRYLAFPLSGSGDYYISIMPLEDHIRRYYPVMRKLAFRDGLIEPVQSDDVEVYAWPGGVYEAVLSPGILPKEPFASFPFTVDRLELADGLVATMYFEGGMRLAVEEGTRVIYGTAFSSSQTGRIIPWEQGGLAAVAGDGPQTILVLSREYEELLRVSGDAVEWDDGTLTCIERLPTLCGHERKRVWRYVAPEGAPFSGGFEAQPTEAGFFTREPPVGLAGPALLQAFCEAVREGMLEEARAYMTPSLQETLDLDTLQAFFGGFEDCRPPITDRDRLIGLTYPPNGGVRPVRLFEFALINGLIDDVSEG